MRIAVGSDHAAWTEKDAVVQALRQQGHEVQDLGTDSGDSTDYPLYAYQVADAVAGRRAERGILICGTGTGMSIAANRVPGVRAASVFNEQMATMCRAHNDANVLCLGARVVSPEQIRALVALFLETPFEGGRHGRRVAMFDDRPAPVLPEAPPRLRLARLPTPIEAVPRWPRADSGVELYIKRDDLTGAAVSGNKIRKLEYSFGEAHAQGAEAVVTCGGAQSNHCRATALLAARLGLRAILFLRRSEAAEEQPDGNLLLARMAGAEIRFVTPDEYADRDRLMAETGAYVIPEGASNTVGAWGYAGCVQEIVDHGVAFDYIWHAAGSGGTTAGLLLGQRLYGMPGRVVAVAVCDDRAYFQQKIRQILPDQTFTDDELDIREGYVGRGYALSRPEELRLIAQLAAQSGLVLDPVYSGKAFFGLCQEIDAGRIEAGSKVLFIHTGGIFGLFPKRQELARVF